MGRYNNDKAGTMDYSDMNAGGGRYDGEDTYGGNEGQSETARRYQDQDVGTGSGYGTIPDKMPSDQSLGSLERSLPDESPSSLQSEADRAAKRVGKDSEFC